MMFGWRSEPTKDNDNKAIDCRDAIEELKETQSELYQQAFDNISTQYDGLLSLIEHEKNMLDEYISQAEESGYITGAMYYQALINAENDTISELQKQRSELEKSLNEALTSGALVEGSEAWIEMKSAINDVTLSIEESKTAIIEYNNSIRELEWEIFDLLQEKISQVAGETEFLIDLLSSNDLYTDIGQLTDEGLSTLGLHGINYNTYLAQAEKYAEEIQKIEKQLNNDPYDQELINRRQELVELQQESIIAANGERQAIIDMVQEGIDLELEALDEKIEKYKDALNAEKDLYDYQRKVKEQTEEISSLEKQMVAYAGDNSEETKAKIQQLKVSLEEANKNLEETQYERYISDQEKLLDELYDEYETILNNRLDNVEQLISDMIDNININSDKISEVIERESDEVGYVLSDGLKSILGSGSMNDMIMDYNNGLNGSILSSTTTLNNSLQQIISGIYDMQKILNNNDIAKIDSTYSGYSSGAYKISKNKLAWTQEGRKAEAIIRPSDGAILTPLAKDDSVLKSTATSNLFNFANNPTDFIKDIVKTNDYVSYQPLEHVGGNQFNNDISIQIDLPNVTNYEEFKYAMQHDKGFERMVRSMTVDKMFGGSSLKKYKY